MRRTIYIATFYFYYYYIIITVIINIIIYFTGGSRSSSGILTAMLLSLLLSVAVALIKYQYYLFYQPLFFSFPYVSCCLTSTYPTTAF